VWVCVLAPVVGRTEEAAPPPTVDTSPRSEDSASRAASDAPLREETPPVDEEPPSVSSHAPPGAGQLTRRILAEVFIGGGAFVVGGVAGQALTPEGLGHKCEGCSRDYSTAFVLGAGLGSGLGVYGAGRLMGGQGDFLATMTGAGLGTGAALLMLGADDDRNGNVDTYTALLMPLAGAIAGYEISHFFAGAPPPRNWSNEAPRLVPVATTTKDGGLLGGLAGRF
jgi:hypothetical protein